MRFLCIMIYDYYLPSQMYAYVLSVSRYVVGDVSATKKDMWCTQVRNLHDLTLMSRNFIYALANISYQTIRVNYEVRHDHVSM